ncbi:hypothetical protein GCM10010390_65200 [Streptomyces mordarskii]|uniref:Transcriptional regulator WhiB n=1 Tax=Streptomyces mordarskii TaxID=1226758 RepID=A0ABN1DWJ7_9ACTN
MTAPTLSTRRATTHAAPARDWRHDAACRDEDADLFFPVGISGRAIVQAEDAKAVCARCPVRRQCLEWATETVQDSGVWGGLTEQERRLLRRPSRTRMPYSNGHLRHVQILRHQLGRYLDLAAAGLTDTEIAQVMGVAPSTIRKVREVVKRKTWTVSA